MSTTTTAKPDSAKILNHLKDFQRATVEYVFRRMYLDDDCVRRFLIADEAGLGKTLVARGLIAKAIDHLWDRTDRIDVIYVCSNADIARQNINRLNVTGSNDLRLVSRITLLPINVQGLQHGRLNFVSFTPRTSFELASSPGKSNERELLYHLLPQTWKLSFNKATRVLAGSADTFGFRGRVQKSLQCYTIHSKIADAFALHLEKRVDLPRRFEELCEEMPRAGVEAPHDLHRKRNGLIGDLRHLLARTCLEWLKPNLIILDEFQRFKHLLQENGEEAPEASELAHHLFNYHSDQNDPATAARVLLLSATPYKMYTMSQESEQEDHYQDFRNTLGFLLSDAQEQQRLHGQLKQYREELFRLTDAGHEGLKKAKEALEDSLRRVMVRTERLALSADRNGMLREMPCDPTRLTASDVQDYLALQRIARAVGHDDVMEYWKSAPYLLNFMDDYDLKSKFAAAIADSDSDRRRELLEAVSSTQSGWLDRGDIERYRPLDPGNARLRYLYDDTIKKGAWRLLWMPPSLHYYLGKGAFTEPQLEGFTKRLVFSCWRVVPKAISAVLSYEAERLMMRTFRKRARNTAEARKKRRPLLRFTVQKGRLTGMPVLGLIYPCRTLARQFDPLRALDGSAPMMLDDLVKAIEPKIDELLSPFVGNRAEGGAPDAAWYWTAPLLLDLAHSQEATLRWFEQPGLDRLWAGENSAVEAAAEGWSRHVEEARKIISTDFVSAELGPAPPDLARTLAYLAVAGPGVVALRALGRIAPDAAEEGFDLRQAAGPLAYAFRHLFNQPEAMALLRDRQKQIPYWRSVLEYCAAGNLQAVLDEYVHVLVESLGLLDRDRPDEVARKVSEEIQRALTLKTSGAQAHLISSGKRRIRMEETIRLRARFAMRFGDQDADPAESAEPTRADQVRAAFNSPFWPFVLATTSVGQEGLDFHTYCHAVMHWNLPSNPVDLEQREGRVHRYKGHAVRKNIATEFSSAARNGQPDPWKALFDAARLSRPEGQNDLFPFWLAPKGNAKIERHLPILPHSREVIRYENLRRALVLYRMVFGQNRQEDLISYLKAQLPEEEVQRILELCRIDLCPINR